MSIILQSSGGGQITIQEPATASNFTQTLPAATGTVMVSGNMPAFSAWQSVAQTGITASTWTKITLTTENFDTNNNYASSRFTPTVAGYYQINGTITLLGGNTAFYVFCGIYKNGTIFSQSQPALGSSNFYPTSTCGTVVYLNGSTDYVELYAFGNASGAWSTYNTLENTNFSGVLVRAA